MVKTRRKSLQITKRRKEDKEIKIRKITAVMKKSLKIGIEFLANEIQFL